MSAFTKPLTQAREALRHGLYRPGHPDGNPQYTDALAALDRVERLATDMEERVEHLEWLLGLWPAKGPMAREVRIELDKISRRAVLSAREEGADTR